MFSDAFLTAKIIGYDPTQIKALRSEVQELKQANAQLRAMIQTAPITVTAQPVPFTLEARVAKLETSFAGLQNTLTLVVQMLTTLLTKLQ